MKRFDLSWEAARTNTFRKSYKRLSPEITSRVDEALNQLLNSGDPRRLGLRKLGKWKGTYTYEIGKQFRVLYRVRFEDRTIELLDVGPHTIYR